MNTNNIENTKYPEMHLCINKGRIKVYNRLDCYFDDNQEFQLELYNPTQHKVLCKIQMNGALLSEAGLSLKPGERVYLDRFFDQARKFLYQTYVVDGSPETKEAIAKNGDIYVEFYKEDVIILYNHNLSTYISRSTPRSVNDLYKSSSTLGLASTSSITYSCNTTGDLHEGMAVGALYSDEYLSLDSVELNSTIIETGRIEMGSESSQELIKDEGKFKSYPFFSKYLKIRPKSQKPIESSEIRNYCGKCGTKARKGDLFCCKCGTEL